MNRLFILQKLEWIVEKMIEYKFTLLSMRNNIVNSINVEYL
jgi:hypothetical protein